jgi:hypothetical protein
LCSTRSCASRAAGANTNELTRSHFREGGLLWTNRDQVEGEVREQVGKATGDESMEKEGGPGRFGRPQGQRSGRRGRGPGSHLGGQPTRPIARAPWRPRLFGDGWRTSMVSATGHFDLFTVCRLWRLGSGAQREAEPSCRQLISPIATHTCAPAAEERYRNERRLVR